MSGPEEENNYSDACLGKAKVGEPSDYDSGDDQRNEPGPVSGNKPGMKADELAKYNLPRYVPRSLEREAMCLIVALTSQEIDGPGLHLGADEAFLLTNREETVGNPLGRFSEDLHMTDVFDNRYLMKLSNHNTGSPTQFLLNRDWSRFDYVNKLKAGDELWIFRLLDPVSKNTFYARRNSKNPGNLLVNSDEDAYQEPAFLAKTLISQNLVPEDPALYINASEAYTLTECEQLLDPSSFSEESMMLCVYDEKDEEYNMLLSQSEEGYSISGGWGVYVRDYKLGPGDQIFIRKYITLEEGVEPFYHIDYIRKEESRMVKLIKSKLKRKAVPGSRFSYLIVSSDKKRHKIPRKLSLSIPSVRFENDFDAYIALDCPKYIPRAMVDEEKEFTVFDMDNRQYRIKLLFEFCSAIDIYVFNSEWERLVENQNLKPGDYLWFDKHVDTAVCDDIFYVLKFLRTPKGSKASSNDEKSGTETDDSADKTSGLGGSGDMSQNRTHRFKILYHRVVLEKDPDEGNDPCSREFPVEAICLSKTLTEFDIGNLIYFDAFDAFILSDGRLTGNGMPMLFLVFDVDGMRHEMMLYRHTRKGGLIDFCFKGCGAMVKHYGLKKGDTIAFYKFLDRKVHSDYYYVVLKLPAQPAQEVDDIRISQGSLPLEEILCFRKTMVDDNLELDVFEAEFFLTSRNCSKSNGTFPVYDLKGRRYMMRVSYLLNYLGKLVCILDHEWNSFVKDNDLIDGSTIYLYKHIGYDEEYFVLRSGSGAGGVGPDGSGVSGVAPDGSGVSGVEPSGSGQKEA